MNGKNVQIINHDKIMNDTKKIKLDFNNLIGIPKLNMNKIKLLKPKIDASNGGHPNMLKLNFNLLNLNNCGNKEFIEVDKNFQNFNCENLLKHPKLKNLKKLKENKTDKINLHKHISQVESQSENKIRDDETDILIRTDKEMLDSTNISNLNLNTHNLNSDFLFLNVNNNFHDKHKKLKIEQVSMNTENINQVNLSINNSESEKDFEKIISKNKQNTKLMIKMKSLNQNNLKVNDVYNYNLAGNDKKFDPFNSPENKRSRNKNQHHEQNIKRHKSAITITDKHTKSLLNNTSLTLNSNLQKLAVKLKQNTSMDQKKEEKVEILKSMVEGLTKLTTIMLEDLNSENEHEVSNSRNISNPTHKNKSNLLISSTTGNLIKQENGKILTNTNFYKNTIDYDQTINNDGKSFTMMNTNLAVNKELENRKLKFHKNSRKNSKIKIEELIRNNSFSNKSNKNFSSNNSFIMKVNKNNLSNPKSKSKHKIKNLLENRYSISTSNRSTTTIKRTATATDTKTDSTYSDKKINKMLNSTLQNFQTIKKNKLIKNNHLNNLTTIDHSKDYIVLNKNHFNNLSTINADNQKFKIDKFELRISKNFHQMPMRVFDIKRDCEVVNNFDRNKLQNKKQINLNGSFKKNDTIDLEDFLPNYEFVD